MTRNAFLQLIVLLGIFAGFFYLTSTFGAPDKTHKPMGFSELVQVLETKPESIKSITVVNGSDEMKVEVADGTTQTVVIPSKAGESLVLQKAEGAKVKVLALQPSGGTIGEILVALLINLLPWVLIMVVFLWIMGRAARSMGPGQLQQMARQQHPSSKKAEKKTFADVAGCEEAIAEMEEIVEYLRDPNSFTQFGARPPKGVLLCGPPGTGKTLLARATAGEANAAFYDMSASEFVELFVGVGASRVREAFDKARQNAPAIIFIDELDAVGRQRGAGVGGGHDEREQTLNQLLTEMDGFNSSQGVIIMAATNRPDVLDPALIRPGRFDRQILVDAPDLAGRVAIFKIHTKGKPLAASVDLRFLAQRCAGFTGADIEGACNEAATVARRRYTAKLGKMVGGEAGIAAMKAVPREIILEDFDEGIDRVKLGVAKVGRAKSMTAEDKQNTSIHELGHALMASLHRGGDAVTKITIIPRSRALGYTDFGHSGDRYNYTVEQLHTHIIVAMGGRAAQEVLLGTVDTGASNDFQQAYSMAKRMVTEWGMSSLGPISVSGSNTNPFLGRSMAMPAEAGPKMQDRIDCEVHCIVSACLERAKELVASNRDFMWEANKVMLENETVLGPQWLELMAAHGIECHKLEVKLDCGHPCQKRHGAVSAAQAEPAQTNADVQVADAAQPAVLPTEQTPAGESCQ